MSDSPSTTPPLPDEPGIGSVILEALKGGAKIALLGAAAGLAATAIAHFSGIMDVAKFFTETLGIESTGATATGLLVKGTLTGAAMGVAVGTGTGGYAGLNQMQHYYHDVALPREHVIGKAQGVALGAALEHEAMAHEAQGRKYRDAIDQQLSNVKGQIAI